VFCKLIVNREDLSAGRIPLIFWALSLDEASFDQHPRGAFNFDPGNPSRFEFFDQQNCLELTLLVLKNCNDQLSLYAIQPGNALFDTAPTLQRIADPIHELLPRTVNWLSRQPKLVNRLKLGLSQPMYKSLNATH